MGRSSDSRNPRWSYLAIVTLPVTNDFRPMSEGIMKRALGLLFTLGALTSCGQPFEPRADPLEPQFAITSTDDAPGVFAYVTTWPFSRVAAVSVIDTETNEVVTTVPVGSGPTGAAVTPEDAFAYVTDFLLDEVSVIDTRTNEVVATIPVGDAPIAVAITPDGAFAYVANSGSSTVSVIETATNTVVKTIQVGWGARAVAFTPDGGFALLVGNGVVSVISTVDHSILSRMTAGWSIPIPDIVPISNDGLPLPVGIAITPDGASAYVVNGSETFTVIDLESGQASNFAFYLNDKFPRAVAITPSGHEAYLASPGDDRFPSTGISVIETDTHTLVASIDLGSRPRNVAIAPDGRRAYVTGMDLDLVFVIDTYSRQVIARIEMDGPPFGVAFATVGVPSTPEEQLQSLAEEVLALELHRGIEQALSGPLDAALQSIESDRPAVVQQLQAFINQVEALRGIKLTDAEADAMIAAAEAIIDAIDSESS